MNDKTEGILLIKTLSDISNSISAFSYEASLPWNQLLIWEADTTSASQIEPFCLVTCIASNKVRRADRSSYSQVSQVQVG